MADFSFSSMADRRDAGCVEIREQAPLPDRNLFPIIIWALAFALWMLVLWRYFFSVFLVFLHLPSRSICLALGFAAGFIVCGLFYDRMVRDLHRSAQLGRRGNGT